MFTPEQQQQAKEHADTITKNAARLAELVDANKPAVALIAATRINIALAKILPLCGAGAED